MTTTNTPAATTTAPAAEAPTKMDHAKKLFNEIFTPGYKFKHQDAKSQRGEFIKRAMAEFGMTKAGAGTYYQNLSNNIHKGEKLYKYTPKKKGDVAGAEGQLKTTTAQADASKDLTPNGGDIGKFRWIVENAEGTELESWATRSEAQGRAKELGVEWADRKAKPAAEEPEAPVA